MKCFMCYNEIDNKDNAYEIFNKNFVCQDCYKKTFFLICNGCGKNFPEELNFDNEMCPSCHKDLHDIYAFNYKPIPIFHGLFSANRKHCLHIGTELELEIEDKYGFINDFNKSFSEDYFYLKEDGSLDCGYGVEIVSQPMILPIAIKEWEKMYNIINKYQVIDSTNCGLHFHLDREYLNERQIRNIDYIINNFTDTVFKIGGRNIECNSYASRVHKGIEEWGKHSYFENRYQAVNLTNKETVELRCFNSTDDFYNFKNVIITVFALVEYCNLHTFNFVRNREDDKFFDSFCRFVKNFKDKNLIY